MGRSKPSSKKQQKSGIDFKKIKRKLGRKLPPPKNATNTEIKSKAIVLPEQSVAADKAGLALSRKGLTLKELLQKTSHHNPKVRKDALVGIKDLLQNHPAELQQHKLAVIEKLRERISDDDNLVRETLYQLFKSVIFPGCKEDTQGPFVSLIMAYIFNAMTHLALDIRLTAFKYFDLIVQCYPATFLLYAEKILQNYKDIIQKNQLIILDKGKLKIALSGLVRCLLLLPSDNRAVGLSKENSSVCETMHAYEPDSPKECNGFLHMINQLKELVGVLTTCFQDFIQFVQGTPVMDGLSFDCIYSILQSICLAIKFFVYENGKGQLDSMLVSEVTDMMILDQSVTTLLFKKLLCVFPLSPTHDLSNKDDERYFILNKVIAEIFLQLIGWAPYPADLWDKLLEFIENVLLGKLCRNTRSGKAVWEKNLLSLLPFIPKIMLQVEYDRRDRLLKAFTTTFEDCDPESLLKMACVSTIEEMFIPKEDWLYLDASDQTIYDYRITWIRELFQLLIQLGNKNPSSFQIVLQLLLRLGQRGFLSSSWRFEDEMQYALRDFYSTYQEEGDLYYGPFLTLPKELQELSICYLYYISRINLDLLKSIATCCLCPKMESSVLFRIMEVLHASYKSGHIRIAEYISFLITLVSRFKVIPEKICPSTENDVEMTNRGTFRALCRITCSCLSDMGDTNLVYQILAETMLEQLVSGPSLDHTCAMLRILLALDRRPYRLFELDVVTQANVLVGYLLNLVQSIQEDEIEISVSAYIHKCRYYLTPCFVMFERSHKLLSTVFLRFGSITSESSSSLLSKPRGQSTGDSLHMIQAVVFIILLMHGDSKARKLIATVRQEIDQILQTMLSLLSPESNNLTIEDRHNLQSACDRLKLVSSSLPKKEG